MSKSYELVTVLDKINQLGWEALAHICAQDTPIATTAFSPLSITIGMAMLAGGAVGCQCQELCAKLGLANPDVIAGVLARILKKLTILFDSAKIGFKCENALFTEQRIPSLNYIQHLYNLDAIHYAFQKLGDSVKDINRWILRQTHSVIPHYLTSESLADSQCVLINMLLFIASWRDKIFDPANAMRNYPFHPLPASTTNVEMMFSFEQKIQVDTAESYTAIRLEYDRQFYSERCSFLAYLPHQGKSIADIIPAIIPSIGAKPHFEQRHVVVLGLPRFRVQTTHSLKPMLETLGYPLSGSFSAMGAGDTHVSHVFHSVAVKVDERGTAPLAGQALPTECPPRRGRGFIPSLVFDRPFAFAVVVEDMAMPLFIGVFAG